MNKHVSIYIPTFNRPDRLARALASLLRQTYRRFEVLVCDDASTVSYDEVLERFKNEFDHFIYLRNEKNSGACVSRNRMIEQASGDYITGLDDDDWFDEQRLENFLTSDALGRYALLCSHNVSGDYFGKIKNKIKHEGVISFEQMKKRNEVGNQAFIAKDILIKSGMFDPVMPAWQDYDTWFRVIQKHGEGYKTPHIDYYVGLEDPEQRMSTSSKAHQGYLKFVEKHRHVLSEEHLETLHYEDKFNRCEYVSFWEVFKTKDTQAAKKIVRYHIKDRHPKIYGWVKKYCYESTSR
ncbi:glycosyltransferase [Halotalea alkalilenta]|uniref:glycosyltransferase n=1 Tax=Halotalea alkalilenta TaxID=376489 RepID=UPI000694B3DA|nr:glycosyltransferase [Halotalea alkalilenta]